MCLFVLCVLCWTVLVNCLLNAFSICAVFDSYGVFGLCFLLLTNPCIVFQRVCVLCLCSQCVSNTFVINCIIVILFPVKSQ